jgi:ABC-type uncharacterized transport system substrate-binding protein
MVDSLKRRVVASAARWRRYPLSVAACLLGACVYVGPALAHPHVFVTMKARIIFDAHGHIAAIRQAWTFDDMYSAFATEGLGTDGKLPTREQLAPLAKANVESLAEFGYFTVGKASGKQVEFTEPVDYFLEENPDKLVTLTITLPLKTPASAGKAFSLQVYDPTYFVAFGVADKDAVTLEGAPKGCSSSVVKPVPLEAPETQKLSEAFFAGLSPGADFGIKLASRIVIACP